MAAIMGSDSKAFERAVIGVMLLNAAAFGWGLLDAGHRQLAEHVERVLWSAIRVGNSMESKCNIVCDWRWFRC